MDNNSSTNPSPDASAVNTAGPAPEPTPASGPTEPVTPSASPADSPASPADASTPGVVDPAIDGPLNFVSDPNAGKITGSAASLLGDAPAPASQPDQPNQDTSPADAPSNQPLNPLAPVDAPNTSSSDASTNTSTAPAPASNPSAEAILAAAANDPGFDVKSGAFGPGQPKKKANSMLILLVFAVFLLIGVIAAYFLLPKK